MNAENNYRNNGQFTAGNSGRPKGSLNKSTRDAMILMEGEATALACKAVDMALAGDPVALKLCLDRIAPIRKDAPVNFELPKLVDSSVGIVASRNVMQSLADGTLTPSEATQIFELIEKWQTAQSNKEKADDFKRDFPNF